MSNQAKPHLHVAAGLIVRDDHVFVAQRAAHDTHAGFWEFPGGKVEPGETHYDALCRELKEEVDITVQSAELLQTVEHDYPARSVSLYVFRVTEFLGEPKGHEGQSVRWVTFQALKTLKLLEANESIVEALLNAAATE